MVLVSSTSVLEEDPYAFYRIHKTKFEKYKNYVVSESMKEIDGFEDAVEKRNVKREPTVPLGPLPFIVMRPRSGRINRNGKGADAF
jgi:hypothetical protein